jgi:hypothetical protein
MAPQASLKKGLLGVGCTCARVRRIKRNFLRVIIMCAVFNGRYEIIIREYCLQTSLLTWVFLARYSLFYGKQNLSPDSLSRFTASLRAGSALRYDMLYALCSLLTCLICSLLIYRAEPQSRSSIAHCPLPIAYCLLSIAPC